MSSTETGEGAGRQWDLSRFPMGVSLRAENEHDHRFLEELYISTRIEEVSVLSWTEDAKQAFLRGQFIAQSRSWEEQFPSVERWIVQVGGADAGRLYLDHREDELRIVDIALIPDFRGRGVGSTLLEEVLKSAREKHGVVRIHVEKNNPALRLYQRLGFHVVNDAGMYWLMEYSAFEEDCE